MVISTLHGRLQKSAPLHHSYEDGKPYAYVLKTFQDHQLCNMVSGTNLYDATINGIKLLELATDNGTSTYERASMIIILTDGQPTVGN